LHKGRPANFPLLWRNEGEETTNKSPTPEILEGHGFGFRLERVAKRGSHAFVWQAVRSDGLIVAIKVRDRESGFPIEWFEREGRLLKELTRLGVPGLVPLLGILDCEGEPALVFPWRPLTLGQIETKNWSQLRPILATVGKSLERLHHLGWIHGDVSPGNILLDDDGQNPLLTDFGLAKRLQDSPVVGGEPNISATHGFVDPSHPEPGPHTDWHSLGVCAWLAMTGCLPETGQGSNLLIQSGIRAGLEPWLAQDLAWWLLDYSSPRRLMRWLGGGKKRLTPKRQRFIRLASTWKWLAVLAFGILLAGLIAFRIRGR
jgi:serine/threonine protein kinase